jgi:hypothetical protein
VRLKALGFPTGFQAASAGVTQRDSTRTRVAVPNPKGTNLKTGPRDGALGV